MIRGWWSQRPPHTGMLSGSHEFICAKCLAPSEAQRVFQLWVMLAFLFSPASGQALPLKSSLPSLLPPSLCWDPPPSRILSAPPADACRTQPLPLLPTFPPPCVPSVPAGPAAVCSSSSPWKSRGPQSLPALPPSKSTCPTQVSVCDLSQGISQWGPDGLGAQVFRTDSWGSLGWWVFLSLSCPHLLNGDYKQWGMWQCGKWFWFSAYSKILLGGLVVSLLIV